MSSAASIDADLLTAGTEVQKIADIKNDEDYVFDFLNATKAMGTDGFLVAATSSNYPALLTGNGAMVYGFLGPCGLNPPHTHPLATELQMVVSGGPIATSMTMENGARTVNTVVPVGSAMVFPKGSTHLQQNLACSPTTFVSSFDYYDPGTSSSAQLLFGFDPAIVSATLGEVGMEVLHNIKLTPSVIIGTQECLDRCGIDRATFNFSSSFADYAQFTNSSWAIPSQLPASVSSAYMSMPTGGPSMLSATNVTQNPNSIPFSQNPLRNWVIGLGGASAVLMVLSMGMLMMMFFRRRNTRTVTPPPPMVAYTYTTPYDDAEMLTGRSPNFPKET